jgi:hypothetical protein
MAVKGFKSKMRKICPLCQQKIVNRFQEILILIAIIFFIALITVEGITQYIDMRLNHSHVCNKK